MQWEDGPTICKACRGPLIQVGGGHRRREYCGDTCKQAAYRDRQTRQKDQKVRERWIGFQEETQNQLDRLMKKHGRGFAQMIAGLITSERTYAPQDSVANEILRERVTALEQQLARYRHVIDLDAICPWTLLTPVQQYLRDHPGETVPIKRQGRTIRVAVIDNYARAVSERHGLIRLNDDEIEQCRLYVLKQLGQPVTVRCMEDGTIVSI